MNHLFDRIALIILSVIASWFIRFLRLTMRFHYVNFSSYRETLERGGHILLCFWHGRLLMMPYSYPGKKITVLVSRHRDGELVSRTVKRFKIDSVRGSTTRGWFSGVKGLLKSVRQGSDIAITPDGPKGPCQRAQMGAIQIAERTGLPIIPMAFGASKKKLYVAGIGSLFHTLFPKGCLYALRLCS